MTAALILALTPGLLSVSGPKLVYQGQPVMLRGVCVGDILLSRRGRSLADYRTISRDWGANAVRIGVAPTSWAQQPHAEVMADLRREVGAALKERMFVVIDWHTIGWPDGWFSKYPGAAEDLYDSRTQLAETFWRAAAKEFGADGRVAFQIWCEPVRSNDDWKNPLGSSWPRLKPTWNRLTSVIRETGAKNLLLQTGGRWAYDLRGIRDDLMEDSNTAYHWHVYGGHDGNDPKKWDLALDDLWRVRPVIVSEWGFEPDSKNHYKATAESFGRPFVRYMNERGLHGLAWCWHDSWGPAMLKRDGLTDWGSFVQDWLKQGPELVRP